MIENVIKVEGLKKSYGNFTAVDGISFEVRKGSLFAFLGPNGAGKSTTINILTTYIDFDEGKVTILGNDAKTERHKIRNEIGAIFQESVLDKFLTVKENISARAALYGITRNKFKDAYDKIRQQFSLSDIENKRYDTLSGGQKRRTDIARALISTPKILFLDEPSTGLDPQTRLVVWETIKQIQKDSDVTVFLTTHYMEEAAMADYVVMMDKGKIIAEDQPHGLINRYSSSKITFKPKDRSIYESFSLKGKTVNRKNGVISINVSDCFEAHKIAADNRDKIEYFEIVQGNMDDVFLELTGKELREG